MSTCSKQRSPRFRAAYPYNRVQHGRDPLRLQVALDISGDSWIGQGIVGGDVGRFLQRLKFIERYSLSCRTMPAECSPLERLIEVDANEHGLVRVELPHIRPFAARHLARFLGDMSRQRFDIA